MLVKDFIRRIFAVIGMCVVFGAVLFTVVPLVLAYLAARPFPDPSPERVVVDLWIYTTATMDHGGLLAAITVAASVVGAFGVRWRSITVAFVLALLAGIGTHHLLNRPPVEKQTREYLEYIALFQRVEDATSVKVAPHLYPELANTNSEFSRTYQTVFKRVKADFMPFMRQPLLPLWAARETERVLAAEPEPAR